MANPNHQLESVLAQFPAQPHTTPVQEAQLRAAVIADADRLDLLNQQATAWLTRTFTQRMTAFPRANLLALLCAVVVSACATASDPLQSAKEAAAMAMPKPTPATDNPTLSAEEIGKRFLKLLEGLESREDLSLEQVQKVLGVPLRRFDGTPEYLYAHSQPLDEGWYFSVRYISGSPSLLRGVSLDFGEPGESYSKMPAAVCVLDFDYYHGALKKMGFRPVEIRGEIGQLENWRYYKSDITLSIIPQNIVPGEGGRLCVNSIGTLN